MSRHGSLLLFSAALLLAVVLVGALLLARQRTITSLRAERTRLAQGARQLEAEQRAATQEIAALLATATDGRSLSHSSSDAIQRTIALIKSQPAPADSADSRPPPDGPRANRIFAELLDDPAYAGLCTTVFTHEVEVRHGAVLARFRAEPAKIAALTRLLVERKFVDLEAEHVAAKQGLSSIEIPEVRYRARDRLEDEIRLLAGDEIYAQLK